MLPAELTVDRPLQDPGTIEYELETQVSRRLEQEAEIVRRHRVFYPVFRVK